MQYAIIEGEHVPVDVVTLDAVPAVYALYDYEEKQVAAWVFDLPGGDTRILGDGGSISTNLASASRWWAAHFGADLVAVATPTPN